MKLYMYDIKKKKKKQKQQLYEDVILNQIVFSGH